MRNDIITEIMLDDIVHDPFGTALKWQFDIADVLHVHGQVPADWEYVPGAFGPKTDGDNYDWLSGYPSETLIDAGRVCKTIVEIAHKHNLSY